jgi:hypothetical protein
MHDLNQDCGHHCHSRLPVGEPFSAGIQVKLLVDDAPDTALFKVAPRNGGKAHGLSLDIFMTVSTIFGAPPHPAGSTPLFKHKSIMISNT